MAAFCARGQAHPSPLARFAIAPPVVLGFQNQRRDRVRLLIHIQRDEGHVRAAGVAAARR